MNMNIKEKLTTIFNDVLDLEDEITLTNEMNAEDIEEWDSLAHIQLIVAIEKEFNLKFNSSEIDNFYNVGDLLKSINSKVNV